MQLFHRLKHWAAALTAAATVLLAPAPLAARDARPALWQVSDKDTNIYIFGTVHLLPPGTQWRSEALDKAALQAGSLVVETIIDEKNPQAFVAELTRLSVRPGLPPILSRVAPGKQAALRAAIAKAELSEASLNNMETWAAAFALLQLQFKEVGVSGTDGVEQTLRNSFAVKGKPILQLETNSQQLGFFDTLPEHAQRELLEGAIEAPAAAKAQFDGMLAAWMSGDVKAIGKTFNAEFARSPELRDALIRRRNANWAYWLHSRLGQPGTVFVAVGAGHLAGEDSVLDMLKRRGVKVRRIQ